MTYTTNAIETLNRRLRNAVKTKGHFPSEDAARKPLYLAIQNAVPAWSRTRTQTRNWTTALLAFEIHFGDRLPAQPKPAYTFGRTPSPAPHVRYRRWKPRRDGHPLIPRLLLEGRERPVIQLPRLAGTRQRRLPNSWWADAAAR